MGIKLVKITCDDCGVEIDPERDFIQCKECRDIEDDYNNNTETEKPINSGYPLLGEVREMLHNAVGLLMSHDLHEDGSWKREYEALLKKYNEHFA